MSDASPQVAAPLQYAPIPRRAWIGRHRKLFVTIALLIALAIAWKMYWHSLRDRVLWIYWSRQCAKHVMPVEAMNIYELDPFVAAGRSTEPDWVTLESRIGPITQYRPRAVREFERLDGRIGFAMNGGVAFVGTLRRPDGQPRLVFVGAHTTLNAYNLAEGIRSAVIVQPGIFERMPAGRSYHKVNYDGPWLATTLLSGHVDPDDPSHVSFGFDVMRLPIISGTIDMYLQNDDTLRFKLRDTPELQQAGFALGHENERRAIDTAKKSDPVSAAK